MKMTNPPIHVVGAARLPLVKESALSLKEMGAAVVRQALDDAGLLTADALFVGNMLSGIVNSQQQLGAIIANACPMKGKEAFTVEAACGSGGAALRSGVMAIKSGMCDTVVVCGIEKMSHPDKEFLTRAIATASDFQSEYQQGENFVTLNAKLTELYLQKYKLTHDTFFSFGLNAHANACQNPLAVLRKSISKKDYLESRFLHGPLRLYDASPICDGAAAVVLSKYSSTEINAVKTAEVQITGSACATESVSIIKRQDPLEGYSIRASAFSALKMAGISVGEIDFFELHDAYSIIAAISLEAIGFAEKGKAGHFASEGGIFPDGRIPVSTFGGLKARGHALGASGVYQAVESYLQLKGSAGANQLPKDVSCAMIQSIGGTASTVLTHIMQRV